MFMIFTVKQFIILKQIYTIILICIEKGIVASGPSIISGWSNQDTYFLIILFFTFTIFNYEHVFAL